MKTKFSFSKKPRTSIMHHRNLCRKKVGLGSLGFLSFLGITMGVLILMAMGAPSARASLLTYYDFEDGDLNSDSPGLQTTSLTVVSGALFVLDFSLGTNVNAVTPSTNFSLVPIIPEPSFKLGGLTTTGLTDVNLSFAFLSGGISSFTTLTLLVSTTGVDGLFGLLATDTTLQSNTTYTTLSFDVSALTGGFVDNVSGGNLFFEFVFSGGGNSSTARIDNIQVTATPVPEPSSYIGALFGLVGLCWFQRRWLMTRLLSLRQT
jgi:PEP-CTERM motif